MSALPDFWNDDLQRAQRETRRVLGIGNGVDWAAVQREMREENDAIRAMEARANVRVTIRVGESPVDLDAPCDDCKDTRQYQPLIGPPIPCPTCRPAQTPAS